MSESPLPYATKLGAPSGLSIVIADDHVTLTKPQPRGLALGILMGMTVAYAALWVLFARLVLQAIDLTASLGAPASFAWHLMLPMTVHVISILGWTVATAVGWLKYWRAGPVPLQLDVTRGGVRITQPGTLRAISSRYWKPEEVRAVELRPVRGSLTRRALCEIVVRVRRRFPLTVRTSEPIDGAPRAFVDGANRLLNPRVLP